MLRLSSANSFRTSSKWSNNASCAQDCALRVDARAPPFASFSSILGFCGADKAAELRKSRACSGSPSGNTFPAVVASVSAIKMRRGTSVLVRVPRPLATGLMPNVNPKKIVSTMRRNKFCGLLLGVCDAACPI